MSKAVQVAGLSDQQITWAVEAALIKLSAELERLVLQALVGGVLRVFVKLLLQDPPDAPHAGLLDLPLLAAPLALGGFVHPGLRFKG